MLYLGPNIQQLLEDYLPDYYRSDDIARLDDLCKIYHDEEEDGSDAAEILRDEFEGQRYDVLPELNELIVKLVERALKSKSNNE